MPEITGRQAGRVDVHRHLLKPEDARAAQAANTIVTYWGEYMNPESSLEDMDTSDVSTALISVGGVPSAVLMDRDRVKRFARENNEYAAQLGVEHPGRFGLFACLPLPEVDATLGEIEYSLDVLGADGVRMATSVGDKWLADPAFAPVFEELNRRKAVVYTHPAAPACIARRFAHMDVSDAVIEFATDTARAILQIVFGGTATQYPDIKFIFSHAGGTMPALIERFVRLAETPQYREKFPDGFLPFAKKFYYDTAQASNGVAMGALRGVVPVSQILFGTDFPWRFSGEQLESLRASGVFTLEELEAVESQNARRLLPGLDRSKVPE